MRRTPCEIGASGVAVDECDALVVRREDEAAVGDDLEVDLAAERLLHIALFEPAGGIGPVEDRGSFERG